jgi:acyl-CoA thioesterase superfamily protein/acyl-Coa thioesterase superfamily protein
MGGMMTESIFEPVGQDLYAPTEAALGPWTDQALHGGPPAMLMAREIERFQPDADLFVTRLTIELLRPVGRTHIAVRCRLVRPGRKVQLVEASLWQDQREVARATALRIRRAKIDLPVSSEPPPHTLPDTGGQWTPAYRSGPAYHLLGVEIRTPREARGELAPHWAWIRLKLPLIPEETPSGLVRVCAAADFPNGISYVIDPRKITYVNPDITVYMHRLPIGEWVMVDARTWLQPYGTGWAEGALYDEEGRIGRSVQGLLVEQRS